MEVHILFGPTRVGKSKKAQELWMQYHYPIVSVDSRKVYKGMDIGTNKLEALRFIKDNPTALYGGLDLITPDQSISAFEYQQRVYSWLTEHEKDIKTSGGLILHGGTGLYLDVLLAGLSVDTPKDELFREQVAGLSVQELQEIALGEAKEVFEKMNQSDRNNPRRLIRVVEKARMPKNSVYDKAVGVHPLLQKANFIWYDLETDRETLYSNIDSRVDRYVSEGWLKEVESLLLQFGPNVPGLQVMGYKELVAFMQNNENWKELVDSKAQPFTETLEAIRQQHRNYAKRQFTWGKKYRSS